MLSVLLNLKYGAENRLPYGDRVRIPVNGIESSDVCSVEISTEGMLGVRMFVPETDHGYRDTDRSAFTPKGEEEVFERVLKRKMDSPDEWLVLWNRVSSREWGVSDAIRGRNESFKPGDVVRLKSGGPKMAVEKVGSDGVVSCMWLDTGAGPCKEYIAAACLVHDTTGED